MWCVWCVCCVCVCVQPRRLIPAPPTLEVRGAVFVTFAIAALTPPYYVGYVAAPAPGYPPTGTLEVDNPHLCACVRGAVSVRWVAVLGRAHPLMSRVSAAPPAGYHGGVLRGLSCLAWVVPAGALALAVECWWSRAVMCACL
jgi:hypothetical protein